MSRIDSHIAAVRRKLILGLYLDAAARAAFVLATLVLLLIVAEKLVTLHLPANSLWYAMGVAAVIALVLAIRKLPSRMDAAVAIDERLGLKERFSTALQMRAANLGKDPFAKAAVLDAEQAAGRVVVTGKFPISYPHAASWAIGVVLLAWMATLLPQLDLTGSAKAAADKKKNADAIVQTLKQLEPVITQLDKQPPSIRNSEEVKLAGKHLENVLKEDFADPEAAGRAVNEAVSKAQAAVQKAIADNKKFADSQAAKKMIEKGIEQPQSGMAGPVAQIQRDMAKGDLKETAKDLEDLAKNFDEMDKEEQKKATDQMEKLAEALKQLANDPKPLENLEKKLEQAGVDQKQIQDIKQQMQQAANGDKQAQQQLQQQAQQLQQQLQQQQQQAQAAGNQQAAQAAQQMQQAIQNAMAQAQQQANGQAQANQMAQGAQQMAQAMQQAAQGAGQNQQQMQAGMQQMQQQLEQIQQMQQDMQNAQQGNQAMQQAMANAQGQGQGQGQGGQPGRNGNQGPWQAGDPAGQQGGGMGGPGIGNGGQGQKTAAAFGTKTERDQGIFNDKGQTLASVFVKDNQIVTGQKGIELQEAAKAGMANDGSDIDDAGTNAKAREVSRKYFQTISEDVKK